MICNICQEDINNNNNKIIKTPCVHEFCENCLKKILKPECPLCRSNITNTLIEIGLSKKTIKNNIERENFRINNEYLLDFNIDNIEFEELKKLIYESYRLHKIKFINIIQKMLYNYLQCGELSLHNLYSTLYEKNYEGYYLINIGLDELIINVMKGFNCSMLSWIYKKNTYNTNNNINNNSQIKNHVNYLDKNINKNINKNQIGIIINITYKNNIYCDSKILKIYNNICIYRDDKQKLITSLILCDYNKHILNKLTNLTPENIRIMFYHNICFNSEHDWCMYHYYMLKSMCDNKFYNVNEVSSIFCYETNSEYESINYSDTNSINSEILSVYSGSLFNESCDNINYDLVFDTVKKFTKYLINRIKRKNIEHIEFCIHDNILYQFNVVTFNNNIQFIHNINGCDESKIIGEDYIFTTEEFVQYIHIKIGENFHGDINLFKYNTDSVEYFDTFFSYKISTILN
jgi:hypothetical protein